MVIISQCICISKHHIVQPKYLQFLLFSHLPIELEKYLCSEALRLYRDMGLGLCPQGVYYLLMCVLTLQSRKCEYMLYLEWLSKSPESQQAGCRTSPAAPHLR